jgi:hypothetical protein
VLSENLITTVFILVRYGGCRRQCPLREVLPPHPFYDNKIGCTQEMLEKYPNYPLDFLIKMNVDGIAKELVN